MGTRFFVLTPAPLPLCGRGEPRAQPSGVLKRSFSLSAEAPLPHSIIPLSPRTGEGLEVRADLTYARTVADSRIVSLPRSLSSSASTP